MCVFVCVIVCCALVCIYGCVRCVCMMCAYVVCVCDRSRFRRFKQVQFEENRELLRLCLARTAVVDPQLAELATYAFVDDMRQQDICALVGLSAPTLRKRLREFIALARDEIERHVPGVVFAEAPV